MSLTRNFYSVLTRLSQPLLRRKLARRGRAEPGYLQAVEERFGRYTDPADAGAVWVHAVSLGEARAAGILIEALRREWAQRGWRFRLLLTHGTATGRAEGLRCLQTGDVQVWQPWDTPEAVTAFLHHFKPAMGLLMETEVWPNLVAGARAAGLPLALVNARLSEKSLVSAQRLAWLSRDAYSAFSAVWPQTAEDAKRLKAMGAPVAAVLGNIKFDAHPDEGQRTLGHHLAQRLSQERSVRVMVLASSREGEELALARWLVASKTSCRSTQCLVVPRHPQRFDEVAGLFEASGLSVSRRSQWPLGGLPPQADVWLGDSLGEMALYYSLASVALLGGSFEPLGGQNLIEATACACPVIAGPHTFNFADAAIKAIEAGAALRVPDMAKGLSLALDLLRDPMALDTARRSARSFTLAHQGAAARTACAAADLMLARQPGANSTL
jgi:3-deoxy-D-manno-octulosonic-acid transferase